MNKAEKKVLRVLAKVAHKNAENKDLTIYYCPSFLHQPKRAIKRK